MRWRGEGCCIIGPNGAPLFGAGPYSRSNIPFPSFSRAHAGRRACATWPRKRFLLGAEQYSGSTGVTACVCRAICPSFTPPPSVSLCAHAVGPRSGRRVWRHPPKTQTESRRGLLPHHNWQLRQLHSAHVLLRAQQQVLSDRSSSVLLLRIEPRLCLQSDDLGFDIERVP
jgi:hypothetical protein